MPRKERRSTFFEWSCDGPCERDVLERTFNRDEKPSGWISVVGKVFHSRKCADEWWTMTVDPPQAEVEEPG